MHFKRESILQILLGNLKHPRHRTSHRNSVQVSHFLASYHLCQFIYFLVRALLLKIILKIHLGVLNQLLADKRRLIYLTYSNTLKIFVVDVMLVLVFFLQYQSSLT